ncbi:MAG: hypothetical protein CMG46_10080 [Candidatus Marinimicrobia bacterium]|nr:hypothetical protein [Candidatus Neomarinimicrobiota bacterium]
MQTRLNLKILGLFIHSAALHGLKRRRSKLGRWFKTTGLFLLEINLKAHKSLNAAELVINSSVFP